MECQEQVLERKAAAPLYSNAVCYCIPQVDSKKQQSQPGFDGAVGW